MAIKNMLRRAGNAVGNGIARTAVLAPYQLQEVEEQKERYYGQMPNPMDTQAEELTRRLLAAAGTEIYSAYLPELSELYSPVEKSAEFDEPLRDQYNIRWFRLTRWVSEKEEDSLEKLVNVYESLSGEDCNIALIFRRTAEKTEVYLGLINLKNDQSHSAANQLLDRLQGSLRGNFPGSVWENKVHRGKLDFLDRKDLSVAAVSNLPGEKSKKFVSQTIEKLLDGIVPENREQNYTIVLLATPVLDLESRKLQLADLYTGLQPYSQWQTSYTYTESNSTGSSSTASLNVGIGAGTQNTVSSGTSTSKATTDSGSTSRNRSETVSHSQADQTGRSWTRGKNHSSSDTVGVNAGVSFGNSASVSAGAYAGTPFGGGSASVSTTVSENVSFGANYSHGMTNGTSSSLSGSVGQTLTQGLSSAASVAQTLGRAVAHTAGTTAGIASGAFQNVSFGAGFSRSANVTATIGKNEGIVQNFSNYTIRHALEHLEAQMKRLDQASALGMWDFSAYVVSEDLSMVSNVAHSYLALTQGESSFLSQSAVNVWRGDLGALSKPAREIIEYLKELRHPLFGLNPQLLLENPDLSAYPVLVTGTTALTGKELAWSLNFPRKSVSGFPVSECAAFGRNIVQLQETDDADRDEYIELGRIWHLNKEEPEPVRLPLNSLTSHTFIAGSTGSGKTNTVVRILQELRRKKIPFLVIEPAKGEYKDVFGGFPDTAVYGTNPRKGPLLRLNPFSFPEDIHVLEHIDRLCEIFNVCWPMYAAMPAVLKDAILQSYAQCGWDLLTSENRYGKLYPTFKDVADNVRNIINSSEYDAENKGAYKGSLLTRLKSLTNGLFGMIFTPDGTDDEQLFDHNVIVDLSRIGSQESKALLMGLLFLKLQEYRMATKQGMNQDLQHITVLEEAHHLLKHTVAAASGESGSLQAKSVEMLANAIAEMRTAGEGFIIADQAPDLLDRSVIRNTNTKILMKMPHAEDRELSGKAAAHTQAQLDELGRLPVGVASVYQNGWIEPVLCKVHKAEEPAADYCTGTDQKALAGADLTEKLSLMDLLAGDEVYAFDEFIKEHGDLLQNLPLSGAGRAMVLDLMNKEKPDRALEELSQITGEVFGDVKAALMQDFEKNRDFARLPRAGSQILESMVPGLYWPVENLILQTLIWQTAQELNEQQLYEIWCREMLQKDSEIMQRRGNGNEGF